VASASDNVLPAEDDENQTAPPDSAYESVLFRHGDANVMMQVLPVLDEEQFARLLGPASQIIFEPSEEWGEGSKRALRPEGIAAPRGPLRLSEEQMAEIGDVRLAHSRRKIRMLLQNSVPQIFNGMDDWQADRLVQDCEKSGRHLGLTTERGFYQWTYLMAASKGQFITQPHIREHIIHGHQTPDKNLDFIMKTMSRLAQGAGR
jgi:hypothetical protein